MRRRRFLGTALGGLALVLLPVGRVARRVLPSRVTEAIRNGRFPGRVVALDPKEVRRPGRWAG